MTSVGVVGTGISGLTLALRLQQLGVDITVYAEAPPAAMRTGRLPNTVARMAHTVARERALGLDLTPWAGRDLGCFHFFAGGDPPLAFRGDLARPAHAVDFRLLLPAMLELFEGRGGAVTVTGRPASAADVAVLARAHDLVVVGVGRRSLGDLFPPDPARSPFTSPQRTLFGGLFRGIADPDPLGIAFHVSLGEGEVFQMPMWTRDGPAQAVLVEAKRGTRLEAAIAGRDPVGALPGVLAEHAPPLAQRIAPGGPASLGPGDVLQGAVTPVVRRAWAVLPGGTLALAVGDAWITNDPLTGQGANLGSQSAWTAAELIAAHAGPFDAAFGRRVEAAMWPFAEAVTGWTNTVLAGVPDHVLLLLIAAAENQAVADAFYSLMDDPVGLWAVVSDPDRTAAFAAGDVAVSGRA